MTQELRGSQDGTGKSCHLNTTSFARLQHCLSFPFWCRVPSSIGMITELPCSLHQTSVHPRVCSKEQEDLELPLLCRLGAVVGTVCLPSSHPVRMGCHKVKNPSLHYLASVPSQELHTKQALNTQGFTKEFPRI